jgi:hypothetical protein
MFVLCSLAVAQPLAAAAQGSVAVHGGVQALDLQARLDVVGAAGTSVKAWVQTSIDGGVTWFDLVCFAFGGASAVKVARVPGQALKAPQAIVDGTMADDTANDGPIGDRFRVKVTSAGIYGTGTTLTVSAIAKV